MSSIFTQILKKEIPSKIIYEDDDFFAIHDIHPSAPVHVLLITKKEIATLEDIPEEDAALVGKLFSTARIVAKKLGIQKNYKLIMNVGREVQEVHHIHLHIRGGWNLEKPPAKT